MLKAMQMGNKISTEKMISLFLEKGMSLFVVRYRKASPYGSGMFGFEIYEPVQLENVNSQEIGFEIRRKFSNELEFVPDEHNIPIGYLVDTPKNRRVLAAHFYSPQIDVVMLITPEKNVTGPIIKEELKKLADQAGVKPHTKGGAYQRRIDARKAQSAQLPAAEPTGPLTAEKAEEVVFKKYDGLIEYLKGSHGDNWRKSKEYKAVIRPELLKLMGTQEAPKAAKEAEEQPEPAGNSLVS